MRLHNFCYGLVMICGLALAGTTVREPIPAQSVGDALNSLSRQTGLQIVWMSRVADGVRSGEVPGGVSSEEALRRLLAETGLGFEFLNERTVTVFAEGDEKGGGKVNGGVVNSKDTVRVATTDTASSTQDTQQESAAADSGGKLEEIVVTAQKRLERLQDVPVPVTALSAESLVTSNQLRLQDYYNKVPGLGLVLIGDTGSPSITIRGLTTGGFTNPTVGIVVDEIPYGSSTSQGGGFYPPDIDPNDLARIEVLRGPQGTLYGPSSLGGLVKFVTVDPSVTSFSGRIQGGLTSVSHGSDVGHNLRGSINVPLGTAFAVRASGFTSRDPGYIDNAQTGEDDVNRRQSDGGRLAALWQPSDRFSVQLSALQQESKRLGSDDELRQPGLSELENTMLRGSGGNSRKIEVYSATLKAELGNISLTSATGYSSNKYDSFLDFTPVFGGVGGFSDGTFGVTGATAPFRGRTNKFTQEIRLSGPIGERLEWLLGGFYTREKVNTLADYVAVDPATGADAGLMLRGGTPTTFTENAVFADLTIHATDRFDVQFGGRQSRNRQTYSTIWTGPLTPVFFLVPEPFISQPLHSNDDPFTYLVTPRFKVSSDLMVYARFASGYRPGGPNTTCTTAVPNFPCEYDADTTQNYEIGIKGNVLDHLLAFDSSIYYIDWKNIQLTSVLGGFGFTSNAGRAKSQGVEISVESKPLRGLTLSAWAAFNDAVLTEALPQANPQLIGGSGDRLPYGSRWSGSVSAGQEFPLGDVLNGFVGGSVSYVGDRLGSFRTVALRQRFPAYTQVDLHAGIRYNAWTFNAFVTNLSDRRGILRGGFEALDPTAFSYIQPRTVGIGMSRNFGT
jgi:outer membrane receptor protein involved in Fe transport